MEKRDDSSDHRLPAPASHRRSDDSLKVHIKSFVPAWGGLRGIALLGPMAIHTTKNPNLVRFTYVLGSYGLTTFFIMSGFLSTCVMHRQLSNEPGRLLSHVKPCIVNRQVRLYPALLLLVLSITVLMLAVKGTRTPRDLPNMALNTLLYSSNFEPFHASTLSPWKNTWAVGVQEQFYLLWLVTLPLYVRWKQIRKPLLWGLISLGTCLAFGRIAFLLGMTTSRFFDGAGFGGHAFKIMIGAVAPLFDLPSWLFTTKGLKLGLLIILLECTLAFTTTGYFGSNLIMERAYFDIAVLPSNIVAAFTILLGTMNGNRLLESRPIRQLGRLSYAWYLYQVPIMSLSDWPHKIPHPFRDTLLALCASFISTKYLQEPIQKWWKARLARLS
jgi:peptidoglycan/LPS O-acetylase OafA/YrhL